jgi:hypothetical protein
MPAAGPKRQRAASSHKRYAHRQIYALETTGLLVIALLILAITLVRFWHNISWSAR